MFRLPVSLPATVKLPGLELLTGSWLLDGDSRAMRHRSARVRGRVVSYGVVEGTGATVVLLHGWGLAHSSYARSAEQLGRAGFKVIVPDLPGFGRSTDLPFSKLTFESFARVVAGLLRQVGADEAPVHLVGHSFGGAVCAQLAHDYSDFVQSLVLVSSVSGVTWRREAEAERLLAERPLWDWGVHLLREFPLGEFPHTARAVLGDVRHNMAFHLPAMSIVGSLIRRCDLRQLLGRVAEDGILTAVVWPSGDRVVTRAAFEDQCEALGCEGTVVEGNHGWPLANPKDFARVVGELLATGSVAPPEPPTGLPLRWDRARGARP